MRTLLGPGQSVLIRGVSSSQGVRQKSMYYTLIHSIVLFLGGGKRRIAGGQTIIILVLLNHCGLIIVITVMKDSLLQ